MLIDAVHDEISEKIAKNELEEFPRIRNEGHAGAGPR